jgi:hypothetical protein
MRPPGAEYLPCPRTAPSDFCDFTKPSRTYFAHLGQLDSCASVRAPLTLIVNPSIKPDAMRESEFCPLKFGLLFPQSKGCGGDNEPFKPIANRQPALPRHL